MLFLKKRWLRVRDESPQSQTEVITIRELATSARCASSKYSSAILASAPKGPVLCHNNVDRTTMPTPTSSTHTPSSSTLPPSPTLAGPAARGVAFQACKRSAGGVARPTIFHPSVEELTELTTAMLPSKKRRKTKQGFVPDRESGLTRLAEQGQATYVELADSTTQVHDRAVEGGEAGSSAQKRTEEVEAEIPR